MSDIQVGGSRLKNIFFHNINVDYLREEHRIKTIDKRKSRGKYLHTRALILLFNVFG